MSDGWEQEPDIADPASSVAGGEGVCVHKATRRMRGTALGHVPYPQKYG